MKKCKSDQDIRIVNVMNRIKGALYGFAIGDAMGATTEFMEPDKIKRKYGQVANIIGGGWLGLEAGEVTDDTEMSMAVMDAIVKAKDGQRFEYAVKDEFIKWFLTDPKDIGSQCAKGITHLMRGGNIADYNPDGLGNGSLMRALPCALINDHLWNVKQGRMTHNNEVCDDAIKIYHYIIHKYIQGGQEEIVNDIVTTLGISRKRRPTGYVVDTLNNALYIGTGAASFKKGIIELVNDGGDADTIAAIGGSILGARFGYDNIPTKWIDQLDPNVKNKLEKFAEYCCPYNLYLV